MRRAAQALAGVGAVTGAGYGAYRLLARRGKRSRSGRRAVTVNKPEAEVRSLLDDPDAVRRFSPDGTWSGEYELRPAPGARGTEIHAEAEAADLRRAKHLLEAGEIATADGTPAGRRGPLTAVLPTLDTGS